MLDTEETGSLVTRVIDGDTVDVIIDLGFNILHSARIRLLGIDTPESRTRDLKEKKFGIMAKDFVKSMMPIGSMQTLKTSKYDAKGKFGRVLGTIVVNGRDTNQVLIEESVIGWKEFEMEVVRDKSDNLSLIHI